MLRSLDGAELTCGTHRLHPWDLAPAISSGGNCSVAEDVIVIKYRWMSRCRLLYCHHDHQATSLPFHVGIRKLFAMTDPIMISSTDKSTTLPAGEEKGLLYPSQKDANRIARRLSLLAVFHSFPPFIRAYKENPIIHPACSNCRLRLRSASDHHPPFL